MGQRNFKLIFIYIFLLQFKDYFWAHHMNYDVYLLKRCFYYLYCIKSKPISYCHQELLKMPHTNSMSYKIPNIFMPFWV